MANFNLAVEYVLENEGGLVDDKDDSGKITNFGITLATLSAFRRAPASPDDIRHLTKEQAINIYYFMYYDRLKLSLIERNNIVTALLDVAVNMGVSEAITIMKKTLISLFYDVDDEGIDKKTLASLNEVSQEQFVDRFEIYVMNHYNDIVLKNPKDAKFLRGWSRRAMRLLTLK